MTSKCSESKIHFQSIELSRVIGDFEGTIRIFMLFMVATYLIVFVPLSFIDPAVIEPVWRTLVDLIWLAALAGWMLLAFSIIFRRYDHISLFARLAVWGYFTLAALSWLVLFLGLRPGELFVSPFLLQTVMVFGYLPFLIYLLLFQYKEYLPRSLTFVEQGAWLFLLLAVFHLAILLITFLALLIGFSITYLPLLLLNATKIFLTVIFSYFVIDYVTNIKVNNKSNFSFETVIVLIGTVVIELFSFVVEQQLDLWFFGAFALLTSIFYVAQKPTKAKSSLPLLIGFTGFIIFWMLDSFGWLTHLPLSWGNTIADLATIIATVVAVVGAATGLYAFIKKKRFELSPEVDITREDVTKGCDEIVSKNGISVRSINMIMNICSIARQFEYAHLLLDEVQGYRKPKHKPELQTYLSELTQYFQIYLYCSEFTLSHTFNIPINGGQNQPPMRPSSASPEDNDSVPTSVSIDNPASEVKEEITPTAVRVITDEQEFRRYIVSLFPNRVSVFDIWGSYAKNDYIKGYIPQQKIERAKPKRWLESTFRIVSRVMVYVGIACFMLASIPAVTFDLAPALVSAVLTWNNLRLAEIRLKFTEAFKPYETSSAQEEYYAARMLIWSRDWKTLKGINKGGTLYLETADFKQLIHWLQLILRFHKEHDGVYYAVIQELAKKYEAIDDHDSAIKYYVELLNGYPDDDVRDGTRWELAQIYLKKGDNISAQRVLGEIESTQGYPYSKGLLGESYFAQGQYERARAVLESIPGNLRSAMVLAILGGVNYYHGDYNAARDLLTQASTKEDFKSTPKARLLTNIYLAEVYFRDKQFFQSAELFYKAFSTGIMYDVAISRDQENQALPDYKASVDATQTANPHDFRVNLWYFVYYFQTQDTESAADYWNKHLTSSPDYENDFTNFILKLMRSSN